MGIGVAIKDQDGTYFVAAMVDGRPLMLTGESPIRIPHEPNGKGGKPYTVFTVDMILKHLNHGKPISPHVAESLQYSIVRQEGKVG